MTFPLSRLPLFATALLALLALPAMAQAPTPAPTPAPTTADLLDAFATEKPEWDRIKASTSAGDFSAFLGKYPDGTIAIAARARLAHLAGTAPARARYKPGDSYELRTISSAIKGEAIQSEKVTTIQEGVVTIEGQSRNPAMPAPVPFTRLYDLDGGFMGAKNLMRMEPPSYVTPAGPMQPGLAWKQATQIEYLVQGLPKPPPSLTYSRVVGQEKITVAAGSFDTFKIEQEALFAPGGRVTRNVCMQWVALSLPVTVKSECTQELAGSPNPVTSSVELLKFTPGP